MEVHPWLAARLNQLILHALGSCQVAPSDRLLVEGAKVSLREGAASQLAEGSSGLVGPTPLLPAPEEALAVAMLLHADDSIKAASALDMEIARHSDFASKRRLMLHLLQFGGIQATLLFCLPSARPGTASALTGRGNAGGAPARGATPPTTLLGPSPTPEADAEFLASVLQLSPDQLLRIVRARSTGTVRCNYGCTVVAHMSLLVTPQVGSWPQCCKLSPGQLLLHGLSVIHHRHHAAVAEGVTAALVVHHK